MLLSKLRADLSDLSVVAGDGEHELGRASVRRGPELRTRDAPRRLLVGLVVEDAAGEIGLHVHRGLGVHQDVAERVLNCSHRGPVVRSFSWLVERSRGQETERGQIGYC